MRALKCIGHLPPVYSVTVIFQLCIVIVINSDVETVDVACLGFYCAMVLMTVEIILMR